MKHYQQHVAQPVRNKVRRTQPKATGKRQRPNAKTATPIRGIPNYPGEEWKNIEGTDGVYSVSTRGRVKSFARPQPIILKTQVHTDKAAGTKRSVVRLGGNSCQRFVATLVMDAFSENRFKDDRIIYHDGNPMNCTLANLSYKADLGLEEFFMRMAADDHSIEFVELGRYIAGDDSVLETIYSRYIKRLAGYARSLQRVNCFAHIDIEAECSEVLLYSLERTSMGRFTKPVNFFAFLKRRLYWRVLDISKDEKRMVQEFRQTFDGNTEYSAIEHGFDNIEHQDMFYQYNPEQVCMRDECETG